MWCDELPDTKSWATLWHGYVICGACTGIRRIEGLCGACGAPLKGIEGNVIIDGEPVTNAVFMGAEGRYQDWIYLQLMEREWKRPVSPTEAFEGIPTERQPSARASIVILFWTYFETRIERLLRAIYREAPASLVEDALTRYASIGARLDRLYRVACGSTYFGDLRELGFGDVAEHLALVQQRRNAFAHGDPHAIDDSLVVTVVEKLQQEHEAWIAVFNRRAVTRRGS